MAESRVLHLYTLYFPQGGHEAFIEPEIPYLSEAFDEVVIHPWFQTTEPYRVLPENISVQYTEGSASKIQLTKYIKLISSEIRNFKFLKNARYQLANIRNLVGLAEALKSGIEGGNNALHYSYWMGEWATVLGILAKEGAIKGYITRAHGYDLYDERHPLGYQPYRSIQLNGLQKCYPISKLGKDYLAQRLPGLNIETRYLGTADHGTGPMPSDGSLKILTVSRAVPLKRLNSLISILAQCKSLIEWTHLGDGPELDKLKLDAQSLPSNMKVDFKGNMGHSTVMELYQKQGFHLLVSLSTSEGLPVSMMEAISFGIPVLSTDVGGVSEIVNERTGILIPKDFDTAEVARLLDDMLLTNYVKADYRQGVRDFWVSNFSAKNNYPAFIQDLHNGAFA